MMPKTAKRFSGDIMLNVVGIDHVMILDRIDPKSS
jgi:hypothetical protein